MEITSVFEEKTTWQDFASIKHWKKQLKKRSKKKELSESTWSSVETYFPKFLKKSGKTPDELIEESLVDSEIGEDRIDEYFDILKEMIDFNSARIVCYGYIRGFYSHNKINTKNWTTPEPHPTQVKSTDDNFPLWKYIEEDDDFELNRTLLQDFFNRLNPTYRAVAYAILGTGQDVGVILQRNVGFVRNQDSRHKRLSLNDNRSKTSEIIDGFYSIEATDAARSIVASERRNAEDHEPLYVISIAYRKRQFRKLHGRAFRNDGIDELPPATRLIINTIDAAFRNAQKVMGIKLVKGQHSPLRPKRLRKVFRTAADLAGLGDDKARQLMGQSGGRGISSGVYLETAREVQERQYMKIERRIWIFKEPELTLKEKEESKELRKQLEIAKESNQDIRKEMRENFAKYDKMLAEKMNSLEDDLK